MEVFGMPLAQEEVDQLELKARLIQEAFNTVEEYDPPKWLCTAGTS